MKLGSLFDGSGGFPLAGTLCGIEPVFASEVEPYPVAVTKSRFPRMKHLGDVSKVNGGEIDPVDVITFGSPCQDLSVAGKRAGLKHEDNGDDETTRSGLFMEAVRIIKEMRRATNGMYPTFALWENVPGAFSSNGGDDFRVVLEELIKIVEPTAKVPPIGKDGWPYSDILMGDRWSLAYRTLDAQFWGVPQRRRRIYLVLDLGGRRAGKVLFEREGLRGYFEEGGTPWQRAAADAQGSSGTADSAGNCLTPWDVQSRRIFTADGAWPALYGGEGGGRGYVCTDEPIAVATAQSGAEITENGICPTITAAAGMSGNNQPWICAEEQQGEAGIINLNKGDVQSKTILDPKGISPALYAGECRGGGGEMYVMVDDAPAYTMQDREGKPGGGKGFLIQEDKATSLRTNNYQYVFQPVVDSNNHSEVALIDSIGGQAERGWVGDVAPTLKASHYKFPPSVAIPCVMQSAGFKAGQSMAGGIGYQEECAATLSAQCSGTEPTVCQKLYDVRITSDGTKVSRAHCYETEISRCLGTSEPNPDSNHGGVAVVQAYSKVYDARGNGDGETVPTLTGDHENRVTDYTAVLVEEEPVVFDGANVTSPTNASNPQQGDPCHTLSTDSRNILVCPVYCLQGNGIDRADTAGCNGKGWKEGTSYTLNTIDRPAVCYAETYQKTTGPLMANSHPGSYSGQDAYQDMFVVGRECERTETETIAIDRAAFNQGQNAKYDPQYFTDGTAPTLVAKGPSAVAVRYIVRRLTPTECARLQGFPNAWGHPDPKDSLTDEEYSFWLEVRNTHATINGKAVKEYTRDQMLTWYNKLHTDSAEYKMWGNGIALPTALYVMQGIADALHQQYPQTINS